MAASQWPFNKPIDFIGVFIGGSRARAPVQGLRTAPYPPRLRDRPHRFVELVRNLQSDLKTAEPKGPVGCQLMLILFTDRAMMWGNGVNACDPMVYDVDHIEKRIIFE